jgi:hypothetical protein
MFTKLSTFFYRIASWKTLLLAVALYIPFPAYILKNLEVRMNALAGQKIGPIDLLFGYDPGRVSHMVSAYGSEGRAIYAQGLLTIDIAYPIIYTSLCCIIFSLLFRNKTYTPFRLVNVVPVIVQAFDLLENACIVYLLKTYPQSSAAVASFCSVFTNLKWLTFLIVIALILYGFVRLATRGRQQQVV